MTTLVVSLITAIVSAVLASAGTYFTARRDLQLKFDASLRDLRISAYKELWKHLGRLAKYGRTDAFSTSSAQQLRNDLRTWYFETGGLVLSNQTRKDYFTLLDALESVIANSETTVSDENDEFLRVLGSRLRTAMTRDVGTRRTFVFRGDPERDHPQLGQRRYVEEGGSRAMTISTRRRLNVRQPIRLSRTRLISDEPALALGAGESVLGWDSARRAFTVRIAAVDAEPEERLFLLEEGYIVEGPKGWRRGDLRRRSPSVIWREDANPPRQAIDG